MHAVHSLHTLFRKTTRVVWFGRKLSKHLSYHQKIPAWCSKWDFLYRIEFVSPFSLKKSCHCLWEGHEIACGNILWSHWVMQNFNKWRLSKNLCMEVCHNDKHCNHDDSNLLLTVFISIFKCIYWKCPLTVHHSF